VKRLLWMPVVVGTCILIASVTATCRTLTAVTGGGALWNAERAIVFVTSKTLTYRGSHLGIVWGRLKQSFGIPVPASTVLLESSVTQLHGGRTDTFRVEGGIFGIKVVNGSIFARASDGAIVRLDLSRNTFVSADADERTAYLHTPNPYSDARWSHEDRFLGGTTTATTMRFGGWFISDLVLDEWSYQAVSTHRGGVGSVIAAIDEGLRPCDQ